ncbi:PREDICTED: zinc finger protein 563-like [Chinchilla lanigera]|uniref:zinc finger protein 563-like n=1 Tax=Chinchilla lanigera TaxID=34839 RepID=UPI0006987986|nr:PREDICTED: zinc finger protein 563-like [Chinchilla lanigera]
MIAQTADMNVHMTIADIKPGEGLCSRRLLVGPSAADGPIIANTALKPHEQQGFQEKLSTCDKHGTACAELQSFQKQANTSPGEKLQEYAPCVKSYSDCAEESTIEEKPDVISFIIPNDVQMEERNHCEVNMDTCVSWLKAFSFHQESQTHEKLDSREKKPM